MIARCCMCLGSIFKGGESAETPSSEQKNQGVSMTANLSIREDAHVEKFEDAYAFVTEPSGKRKQIGRGHYATVYLAIHKKSGTKVAVKDIDRRKTQDDVRLKSEVEIMKKVGRHKHVVNLFHVFDIPNKRRPEKLRLVMEYCTGGELFDMLAEAAYTPNDAADVTANLTSALKFLHDRDIVHRDLKPENLLLVSKRQPTWVKLADFGLAKVLSNDHMFTVCGTWAYCAPEVKENRTIDGYTKAVDVWSLGVITYIVLSGYHPFDPDGVTPDADLEYRIKHGIYDFNDDAWTSVSSAAKDFVRRCLVVDPKKRMTIDEALSHPWLAATPAAVEAAKARRAQKSGVPHLRDQTKIRKFVKAHKARREKDGAGLLESSNGQESSKSDEA